MNRRIFLILFVLSEALLQGCAKDPGIAAPASLVVVNAMPASNSIYILFGADAPKYFKSAPSIGFGGGWVYSPEAGNRALSVIQSTDTTKPIFTAPFQLAGGGVYSLFITGDTSRPDTMLTKDNIVNYGADSAGVRFVNLSVDAKALSVNMEGGTPGDIATLPYKGFTAFTAFNADANGPGSYNFEVHDAASGDLLTTFSWYYTDHRNNTVVIAGSTDPASPTPLTVFQVNHF